MDVYDYWPAPLQTARDLHITMPLHYIEQGDDAELAGMLKDADTGASLTPAQVREVAAKHRAAGREYLPPCDCTNAQGMCTGHLFHRLPKGWAA